MSAVTVEPRFTHAQWARMLAEPVRDMRYLSTQLGPCVADYLSWKGTEDGAAPRTLVDYERRLARLAVALPGPATDLTTEVLRSVIAGYTEGQRHGATATYKDFSKWLYQEGRIDSDPAGRIRYPKRQPPPITDLFTDLEKAQIVAAQETLRDRVCVLLLLRAGLRKGELRRLLVRDIDLAEQVVLIRHSKGGKSRRVPIRGVLVRYLGEWVIWDPLLKRAPEPDDHILYPRRSANQHGRGGTPNPKNEMAESTAHYWWYACLRRACIVEPNVTAGRRTHLTRHTYATDLGRATGWNMLAVQKNLGHARIGTTIDIYTQFAFEDQELAVEQLPEILLVDDA